MKQYKLVNPIAISDATLTVGGTALGDEISEVSGDELTAKVHLTMLNGSTMSRSFTDEEAAHAWCDELGLKLVGEST